RRTGRADALEKRLAGFGRVQPVGVDPEHDAHAAGLAVVGQLAELLGGPAAPEALDHVVAEAQLAGEAAELLLFREAGAGVAAAAAAAEAAGAGCAPTGEARAGGGAVVGGLCGRRCLDALAAGR